jgi:hypothetical protein
MFILKLYFSKYFSLLRYKNSSLNVYTNKLVFLNTLAYCYINGCITKFKPIVSQSRLCLKTL